MTQGFHHPARSPAQHRRCTRLQGASCTQSRHAVRLANVPCAHRDCHLRCRRGSPPPLSRQDSGAWCPCCLESERLFRVSSIGEGGALAAPRPQGWPLGSQQRGSCAVPYYDHGCHTLLMEDQVLCHSMVMANEALHQPRSRQG